MLQKHHVELMLNVSGTQLQNVLLMLAHSWEVQGHVLETVTVSGMDNTALKTRVLLKLTKQDVVQNLNVFGMQQQNVKLIHVIILLLGQLVMLIQHAFSIKLQNVKKISVQ